MGAIQILSIPFSVLHVWDFFEMQNFKEAMNAWADDFATDGSYVVIRFFANFVGLAWLVDIFYYAKEQADKNIWVQTLNWILYTFGGGFILTAITTFFTSIGLGWLTALANPLLLYAGWIEFGNYMLHYWDVFF